MPGFIRRQSPNSYAVYVPTGQKYPTGQSIRHYETVKRAPGETDRDLDARANARKAELELQYYYGERLEDPKKYTVGDMFAWWFAGPLAAKIAAGLIEASTVEQYKGVARLHILPDHKDIHLAKLCEGDIESLYNRLRTKGVSEIRLQAIHKTYRAALNSAKRKRKIRVNPIDFIDETSLPAPRVPPHPTLTMAEARQFIDAASDDPQDLALVFSLVAGTRVGETLGLRVGDIEFTSDVIHIRQALKRSGANPVFGVPKTRYGIRDIPITDTLEEILRRAIGARERIKTKAGDAYQDFGLLFTTARGTPLDRRNLGRPDRAFGKMLDRAGLSKKMRVHDLRHSFVTLAKETGADSKHLGDAVGHADAHLVDALYAHRSMPAQRELYSRLHECLKNVPNDKPSSRENETMVRNRLDEDKKGLE